MTSSPLTRRAVSGECLSDLAMDRLRGGELEPAQADRSRRHLETCERCRGRFQELEREPAVRPTPAEVDALRQVKPQVARLLRRSVLGGVGVALAAGLAAMVLRPIVTGDGFRPKGGDALALVVRHADGRVEDVLPRQRLVAGDALRFKVTSRHPGYLLILDFDAKGQVSLFQPQSGEPRRVERGTELLDGSVILDESVGPERIEALLCDSPVTVEQAVAAGRAAFAKAGADPERLGPLGLPCREVSVLIVKGAGE